MATVDTPTRETVSPHDEELLIKEARLRARRRRRTIGLVLLIVIAAIAVTVHGGKRFPPKARTAQPPASSRSGASGAHSAATSTILEGQTVQSLWPVGDGTTWIFTMNVVPPYNGGQGIEWTNDGGRTWRNATPAGYNIAGGRFSLGEFFALSANRAWVVAGSPTTTDQAMPRLLATSNGGRTWSVAGTVPSTPCAPIFSSAADGICPSSNGAGGSAPVAIFLTTNGGATWHKTFDNTAGFTAPVIVRDGGLPYGCDKEFSLTSGNVIWAKFWCNMTSATMYRSSNGGRSWTPVSFNLPTPVPLGGGEITGPVVLSGPRGAVSFTEGGRSLVFVTHDGGRTFTPVFPPGPRHVWAIDIVSPTEWHLAFRNEILSTSDAGTSWTGLVNNATSNTFVRQTLRYGSGAPASVDFTSPLQGWMTWFNGNGYVVMNTQNGGRTWRLASIPGTGARGN